MEVTGPQIRQYRKDCNIRLSDFARKCKMSPIDIIAIEKGEAEVTPFLQRLVGNSRWASGLPPR